MPSNGNFGAALIAISFLFAGCAAQNKIYGVHVNSLSRPGIEQGKHYILLPANQISAENDLEYLEYSGRADSALISRGFVKSANPESADVAIFLAYGIGEPEVQTYTYTLPQFGQTGIASSTTTGSAFANGNSAHYSETTTNQPQYGVTGYTTHVGTETTFTRHILIRAYDLQKFREDSTEQVAWETKMVSNGLSSDLRAVVPAMLAAGKPYFGMSSGKRIYVEIPESQSARTEEEKAAQRQQEATSIGLITLGVLGGIFALIALASQ